MWLLSFEPCHVIVGMGDKGLITLGDIHISVILLGYPDDVM